MSQHQEILPLAPAISYTNTVARSKRATRGTGLNGPNMSLPVFDEKLSDGELDAMMDNATLATNFLKAIGHEGRLMILCHLATGEKSVTELEELLSARQAAVSQQLGRLRLEGLVKPRREGKTIFYSLTDDRCKRIISVVYDLFCK